MKLLDDVKVANRITTSDSNITNELTDLIRAALYDLKIAGVDTKEIVPESTSKEVDPLIKRAVILYTKAHFGFDNPEADRFETAFYKLKQHLSLATDYKQLEPEVLK